MLLADSVLDTTLAADTTMTEKKSSVPGLTSRSWQYLQWGLWQVLLSLSSKKKDPFDVNLTFLGYPDPQPAPVSQRTSTQAPQSPGRCSTNDS